MKTHLFSALPLALAVSGIAAVVALAPHRTSHGTLIGQVTEADSIVPLSGATFRLKINPVSSIAMYEAQTAYDGRFRFTGIPAGEYIMEVSLEGYETSIATAVTVKEGDTTVLFVTLTRVAVQSYGADSLSLHQLSKSMPAAVMMSAEAEEFSLGWSAPLGTRGNYDSYSEEGYNTEEYDNITENEFREVIANPLSTFSIDVDNASYSNVRRFITSGQMPVADAVRIEEMINYFDYDYENPGGDVPFSVFTEMSDCPWNPEARLLHIGIQGKKLDYNDIKPSNLVFLIDVSGSMDHPAKLPLVKTALGKLVAGLSAQDKVAIVVYAGAAGLVLPSTPGSAKARIITAIDNLEAGGSTAGGAGIQLAYKVAQDNFIQNGNNRIILVTDGDFNVGPSSDAELVKMIEEKRESGVFLTVCGFGMGNYKDSKMEKLADKGNGNYFYIDNEKEAQKVFVTEMRATLFTIAKDVKIQVEFNPARVESYRLVGYENRLLNREDFEDDTKDAGELGAGTTVTALYEIIPAKHFDPSMQIDHNTDGSQTTATEDLRYQQTRVKPEAYEIDEIMVVKIRYKDPKGTVSKLIEKPLPNQYRSLVSSSENFRWSAAVAEFGMLLRDSKFKGDATYDEVLTLANASKGTDKEGYRAEFMELVRSCMKVVASR